MGNGILLREKPSCCLGTGEELFFGAVFGCELCFGSSTIVGCCRAPTRVNIDTCHQQRHVSSGSPHDTKHEARRQAGRPLRRWRAAEGRSDTAREAFRPLFVECLPERWTRLGRGGNSDGGIELCKASSAIWMVGTDGVVYSACRCCSFSSSLSLEVRILCTEKPQNGDLGGVGYGFDS